MTRASQCAGYRAQRSRRSGLAVEFVLDLVLLLLDFVLLLVDFVAFFVDLLVDLLALFVDLLVEVVLIVVNRASGSPTEHGR